jgi:hypothetical protein
MIIRLFFIAITCFFISISKAQKSLPLSLRVSSNGRFFTNEKGALSWLGFRLVVVARLTRKAEQYLEIGEKRV